jgi:hypothetical protein
MRYSRYYTKRNFDGSRSVLRVGPATTAGMKLWHGLYGTILVFAIAGALTDPWKNGRHQTAASVWIFCFVGVAIFAHYKIVKPRYRREGKIPPKRH